MELIAKCFGGSTLYGLNNHLSDIDIRGVFVNTSLSETIGLSRYEQQIKQDKTDDKVLRELRHYFNLLQKGNSESVELLWNKNWLEIDERFTYIQTFKHRLTDTKKLFKVITGYAKSEKSRIFGINDATRDAIKQYGYSSRNLAHFIRLCYCGLTYFNHQVYPVNLKEDGVYSLLFSIKNHPEAFSPEQVNELIMEWDKKFIAAFEGRDKARDTVFETDLADRLLAHVYFPIIEKAVKEM